MELRHVYGRTYAAVGATALMPVYKLTDTDIVLMDTGYAKLDRSALTNLIEDNGFRLRGFCAPTPTLTTQATSATCSSGTAARRRPRSSRRASP